MGNHKFMRIEFAMLPEFTQNSLSPRCLRCFTHTFEQQDALRRRVLMLIERLVVTHDKDLVYICAGSCTRYFLPVTADAFPFYLYYYTGKINSTCNRIDQIDMDIILPKMHESL